MLASQQFCVKWNSYSSNLQNVFPRLLTSEHFVDITLACEGQMIKCHKVVLSACSTYFEKLLVHNPCQHPIIFMKDMKHWEVQALVDFMYKGEVNVSQDELNSLLVAAEALQIRGLCGSDSVNRSTTQDVNRHGQSNTSSASSRVPSVSLPHDTVLSGGTSVGRESPPFKRRRPPNEEKDHSQSHHTSMPRIANITSTTPNSRGDVNSLPAPQASAVDHIKTDGFAEEMEDELPDKKPIKQELDMDDTFLEGDLDADGPDEDYGSLEHQEDSDSNNREEVPPHSPLDQPGPSGLAPPCSTPLDKAATEPRWGWHGLTKADWVILSSPGSIVSGLYIQKLCTPTIGSRYDTLERAFNRLEELGFGNAFKTENSLVFFKKSPYEVKYSVNPHNLAGEWDPSVYEAMFHSENITISDVATTTRHKRS